MVLPSKKKKKKKNTFNSIYQFLQPFYDPTLLSTGRSSCAPPGHPSALRRSSTGSPVQADGFGWGARLDGPPDHVWLGIATAWPPWTRGDYSDSSVRKSRVWGAHSHTSHSFGSPTSSVQLNSMEGIRGEEAVHEKKAFRCHGTRVGPTWSDHTKTRTPPGSSPVW